MSRRTTWSVNSQLSPSLCPDRSSPQTPRVLDVLSFFQLFSCLAMERIVAYANCEFALLCYGLLTDDAEGLLQMYCTAAFLSLQAQKNSFLEYDPLALYPSKASVFSAATFELGGSHGRTSDSGILECYDTGTWSILTALGTYAPFRGGHAIFWDLGLVVTFPPGSSILIPAGLVRYSFVKVREHERRYSLLQWAGAGITRWFRNGHRFDLEFAIHSSSEEHSAREERRRQAHAEAGDAFPQQRDLCEEAMICPVRM